MDSFKKIARLVPKGAFVDTTGVNTASRYFVAQAQLVDFLRDLAKRYSVFVRPQKDLLDLVVTDKLDVEGLDSLNPSDYLDICQISVTRYETQGRSFVAPHQVYMLYLYDTQAKVDFLMDYDFDVMTTSDITGLIGRM